MKNSNIINKITKIIRFIVLNIFKDLSRILLLSFTFFSIWYFFTKGLALLLLSFYLLLFSFLLKMLRKDLTLLNDFSYVQFKDGKIKFYFITNK
jgi:hypothetical protein